MTAEDIDAPCSKCLFEPIEGRFPSQEMCDRHPNCDGCPYKSVDEEETAE